MTTELPRPMMWDAAFDYVRLTYASSEEAEDIFGLWRRAARGIVASPEGEHILPKRWGALGYAGESYGLVQVGASAQGLLLQASQWAAQAVREMALPYTGAPRCDVQVTVWYDRDPQALIRRYADRSAAAARAAGSRAWRVTYIDGFGNGDTAYLGSRSSDVYVRIYDKGRESAEKGTYENALRYEVEFKNAAAAAVWAYDARTPPGRDALAAVVRDTLRSRNVFLALPGALPSPSRITYRNPPSDTDRRLAWLAVQVRGTVDKLLGDGVSSEELRRLLGLD